MIGLKQWLPSCPQQVIRPAASLPPRHRSLADPFDILAAHNSDDSVFVMFSATFGRREREEARKYMSEDSVTINVGRLGSTIRNIHQVVSFVSCWRSSQDRLLIALQIVWINQELKYTALADCLRSVPQCRTIVFCNTIKTVDNVDDFLFHQGKRTKRLLSQITNK